MRGFLAVPLYSPLFSLVTTSRPLQLICFLLLLANIAIIYLLGKRATSSEPTITTTIGVVIGQQDVDITDFLDVSQCHEHLTAYVYPVDVLHSSREQLNSKWQEVGESLQMWLRASPYNVNKPNEACLFVYISTTAPAADKGDGEDFSSLPYWNDTGSDLHRKTNNHLIILLNPHAKATRTTISSNSGKGGGPIIFAMGASAAREEDLESEDGASATVDSLLSHIDLHLPTNIPVYNPMLWASYLPIVEGRTRKYLLSLACLPERIQQSGEMLQLTTTLSEIRGKGGKSDLLVDIRCIRCDAPNSSCSAESIAEAHYCESTFTLIAAEWWDALSRLSHSLRHGSIPVWVGPERRLPLADLIDWSSAAIVLPPSIGRRLSTLDPHRMVAHLRSIPLAKVNELKRQGRFLLDHHLGDTRVLARTILSAVRFRLGLRAPMEQAVKLPILLSIPAAQVSQSHGVEPIAGGISDLNGHWVLEREEAIGKTLHSSIPPSSTPGNHPLGANRYSLWNINPTYLDREPRPYTTSIGVGENGNDENTKNILGAEPVSTTGTGGEELFTIVMLTYKRDNELRSTLRSLLDLRSLHSVVVLWNDMGRSPPPKEWWPQLHVPLYVLNTTRNSMNARFRPLDAVATEAVFLLDDDLNNLDHDAILFAYHVWRGNKRRMVGLYNRLGYCSESDQGGGGCAKGVYVGDPSTCHYNMVLVATSFFHRDYLLSYSDEMYEAVRQHVDELTNCDDLAFNFMVAHLSRRPPIKATPGFNPKSAVGLSTRPEHYTQRGECIAYFTRVFGYNPLLVAEYRADSVLYKMPGQRSCFENT